MFRHCIDCGKEIDKRATKCRSCAHTKHGYWGTKLYYSWFALKQRCFNEKHHKYPRYGGRGIVMCDEWLDFIPFKDWALSHGYEEGLTIDRVDNDDGWEILTCNKTTR